MGLGRDVGERDPEGLRALFLHPFPFSMVLV